MEKIANPQNTPTPNIVVEDILESLPMDAWEEGKTFVDPECGTGQFLVAVAKRKLELGHKHVLSTIYGTDIIQDKIDECRTRLLNVCGTADENKEIILRNIRCENALEYDFKFQG